MALQSSLYIPDGSTRTFPSTKHIASAQHVGVYLKLVTNDTWIPVNVTVYEVINNSIVFDTAVSAILYSMIEIRVADTQDELTDSPSDISIVATNILDVNIVADNIALLTNALNGEYIVNGLPVVASEGDLAVNVLDGGIYEWKSGAWILIAQSASGGGAVAVAADPILPIVDGLPLTADEGSIVYNIPDALSYAFVNGEWINLIGAPVATDIVGIEVVPTVTALVGDYDLQVVYAQDTKKLMEWILATTSWSEVISPTGVAVEVADASITTAKFAAGLTPVEVLDVLPTTSNFIGRTVYLTTDGKLYRYTATGFISTVATQDLTGTISTVQIDAGAITTPLLAAGAVTADTIGANAITAGKIDALAVTAGTIQAGAIGASEIAAGAILTDKLAAGSITATKMAANSVTAVSIATDAITSDKILANSIIAGKIAVGAVSANQLTANAVTSDKIAANSVTATKIASYSITADKIAVGAVTADKITNGTSILIGGTFSIGEGTAVAGYGGIGAFSSSSSSKFGIIGVGTAGQCGVAAASSSTNYASGHWNSTTSAFTTHRTYALLASSTMAGVFYNTASNKLCELSTSAFALELNGGGYSAFTGTHSGLMLKTDTKPAVGDILVDSKILANDSVNDCICENKLSSSPMQKNVFGVYVDNVYNHIPVAFRGYNTDGTYYILPKYKSLMDSYNEVSINSVGEGMVNVCSENGNISIGDYITTSSVAGKGMKQDDDILHSYTVAKARENVDWSKETSTTKMIACTYHCG